jgi:hypothetical protein
MHRTVRKQSETLKAVASRVQGPIARAALLRLPAATTKQPRGYRELESALRQALVKRHVLTHHSTIDSGAIVSAPGRCYGPQVVNGAAVEGRGDRERRGARIEADAIHPARALLAYAPLVAQTVLRSSEHAVWSCTRVMWVEELIVTTV